MASVYQSPWKQTPVKVSLVPVEPTQETRELTLELGESVTIGRASTKALKNNAAAPGNALFENPVISRQHAKIEYHNRVTGAGYFTITDLASTHGTYVNDELLHKDQEHVIRNGDLIRLGTSVSRGSESYKALVVNFVVPSTTMNNDRSRAYKVPVSSDDEYDESDYGSDVDSEELYMIEPITSSAPTSPDSARKIGTIDSPIAIDDDNNRSASLEIEEDDLQVEVVIPETVEDTTVNKSETEEDNEDDVEVTAIEQPVPSQVGVQASDLTLEPVSQPIAMTAAGLATAAAMGTIQLKPASVTTGQHKSNWPSASQGHLYNTAFEDEEDEEEGPEVWHTKLNNVQLPSFNSLSNSDPKPVQPSTWYRPVSPQVDSIYPGAQRFTPYQNPPWSEIYSHCPTLDSYRPRAEFDRPSNNPLNVIRPHSMLSGPFSRFSAAPVPIAPAVKASDKVQSAETIMPLQSASMPRENESTEQSKSANEEVEQETNVSEKSAEASAPEVEAAQADTSLTESEETAPATLKRPLEEDAAVEDMTEPTIVQDSPPPAKKLKTQKSESTLIGEVGKYTLGAAIGATGTFAMLASPLGGMLADWAAQL